MDYIEASQFLRKCRAGVSAIAGFPCRDVIAAVSSFSEVRQMAARLSVA